MAATGDCANCGQSFERRQSNQGYCMRLECRRAHAAKNTRDARAARRQMLGYRHDKAIRGSHEAAA